MQRFGPGLAIAACLICSSAASQARGQPGETVAYSTQSPAQQLELYRPATSPALLVVFVHGGGWTRGDKRAGRRIADALTSAGYAVASIDTRMPPEGGVADEAQDVASAAAFLLAHAGQFGLQPSHFALAGHSAGGHLVALVATDPSYARNAGLDLRKLATVITLDGVFDMTLRTERNPVFGTDPAIRLALSPISHVRQVIGHPVFCLLHEDTTSRFGNQADAFAAALRGAGQNVTEMVVPGLQHGAMVGRFDDPTQPLAQDSEDCLRNSAGDAAH